MNVFLSTTITLDLSQHMPDKGNNLRAGTGCVAREDHLGGSCNNALLHRSLDSISILGISENIKKGNNRNFTGKFANMRELSSFLGSRGSPYSRGSFSLSVVTARFFPRFTAPSMSLLFENHNNRTVLRI